MMGDCNGWYGKCIRVCCLFYRSSTDMYVELLCFLTENWRCFPLKSVDDIPLLKYITYIGEIMLCSLSQIRSESIRIHLIWDDEKHPWLNKKNLAMGCPSSTFFFPDDVVSAILKHGRQHILKTWLTFVQVNVVVTDVYGYSSRICHLFKTSKDPRHIVVLSHLLYHSVLKNYIRVFDVSNILYTVPVVDAHGNVVPCTNTLVPAAGSRWIKLFGSDNAFIADNKYVVLGEVYAEPAEIVGECIPEKKLLDYF